MDETIEYRLMKRGEERAVCLLVRDVFDEFVAPDFSEEGVDGFLQYAHPRALARRCEGHHFVLVAARGDELLGMIEVGRFEHIGMLFVAQRGRGIARQLVHRALAVCKVKRPGLSRVTVHSSRYAEPIYRKLGFVTEGDERTEGGITFLPMAMSLKPED